MKKQYEDGLNAIFMKHHKGVGDRKTPCLCDICLKARDEKLAHQKKEIGEELRRWWIESVSTGEDIIDAIERITGVKV